MLCFIREENTPSSYFRTQLSRGVSALLGPAVLGPFLGPSWPYLGLRKVCSECLWDEQVCQNPLSVPASCGSSTLLRGREGHCRLSLSTAPAHKEPLAFNLLWLYIVVGVFPCVLFPHPKYRLFEGREYMFVQVCI